MMMHYFYLLCAITFFANSLVGMEQLASAKILDSESKLVDEFLKAATAASRLKRHEILGSGHFIAMKASRNQLKEQCQADITKVNKALFGAGDDLTDDENCYERFYTPEDSIMRFHRLNGKIERNKIKADKNDKKLTALTIKLEELQNKFTDTNQLQELHNAIARAERNKIMLKKALTILVNYKKQEQTHVLERQKTLTQAINANNTAIFQASNLDNQNVSESIAPGASNTPSQKIEALIEERNAWQLELEKINAALEQLDNKEEIPQLKVKKSFWNGLIWW